MIPISRDPKRFRAALNSTRFLLNLKRSCSSYDFTNGRNGWNDSLSRNVSSVSAPHILDLPKNKFDNNNLIKSNTSKVAVNQLNLKPIKNNNSDDKNNLIGSLYGPRSEKWWTGLKPVYGQCPGVEKDGNLYSLPQFSFDNNSNGKMIRESLQMYFDNTWTLTEVLLSSLQGEEAFHASPYHDLRHPLIFYYGCCCCCRCYYCYCHCQLMQILLLPLF